MNSDSEWIDVDRLLAGGWLGSCEVLDAVDSTNTFALQRAQRVDIRELPLLVIARHQTAGRGRGTNSWWSGAGSLACSLLVAPSVFRVDCSQWPLLSVLVGSSVCTAMAEFSNECEPRLKWPNDVYLRERKVCGILVEAPSVNEDRIVIGLGINVNNSFAECPSELAGTATSLADAIGADVDRLDLLSRVLRELQVNFERLSRNDHTLIDTWRAQCLLTGRHIVLDDHQRRVEGTCLGIDDDGALRIQTSFGPQRVVSGVVSAF